jgi:hypothetical protein
VSICELCRHPAPRWSPDARLTREYYDVLIGPLRHAARRCGYALAVHGSLSYDIDLIACPRRSVEPVGAEHLAEEIRKVAAAIIGMAFVREADKNQPEKKPWGRLAWSFYLAPEPGPYIDLSVMPIVKEAQPT